jgi:hypothetical protein
MGQVFTWGRAHPGQRVSMTIQNKNTLNKDATIVGFQVVPFISVFFRQEKMVVQRKYKLA